MDSKTQRLIEEVNETLAPTNKTNELDLAPNETCTNCFELLTPSL